MAQFGGANQVAELTYSAGAAAAGSYKLCRCQYLRVGIGYCNGYTDLAHGGDVGNIVANIDRVFWAATAFGEQLNHRRAFVALVEQHGVDTEFARPHFNQAGVAGADYRRAYFGGAQVLQALPVLDVKGFQHVAFGGVIEFAIGHDAVDVHHQHLNTYQSTRSHARYSFRHSAIWGY